MSRPIRQIEQELPGHILRRRQWIAEMECWHEAEADHAMNLIPYLAVLGIVVTACLVVWVLA